MVGFPVGGGGAAEVLLVAVPAVAGAVVLPFKLRLVAKPRGIRATGFAESFHGAGLEIGDVEVRVTGAESFHVARDGGFDMRADAAETPFGIRHFANEAGFGEVDWLAEVVFEFGE